MSKIIKFGGKSLSNGKGIEQTLSIIQNKLKNRQKIVAVFQDAIKENVVVSHFVEILYINRNNTIKRL